MLHCLLKQLTLGGADPYGGVLTEYEIEYMDVVLASISIATLKRQMFHTGVTFGHLFDQNIHLIKLIDGLKNQKKLSSLSVFIILSLYLQEQSCKQLL